MKTLVHFLLKHDVHYGGEYEGKEDEFLNFTMTYTSYYVRSCMAIRSFCQKWRRLYSTILLMRSFLW